MMRRYEKFFAERTIRDFPEYEQIAVRYPHLQWIDDYQHFRQQNIPQEKRCLVFARKRGPWLKPFHCYNDRNYRFLSLDLAEGCLFDCVYCYLQSYLNHGALVLFVGMDSLNEELKQLPKQKYWISTGLLSDSLLVENHHSYVAAISNHVPGGSVLELRSKEANIAPLLNPDINKEAIVLSWSINPPEVVKSYEYGTASLDERLAAASRAIEHGYRVAFHLDPVFYFSGWKPAYESLFGALQAFPQNSIAFLSVGLFRYMPDLGKVIRRRFPFHPILSEEFIMADDGKYHYFRPIRREMYEAFDSWLKPWTNVPVFWSMKA